MIGWNQAIQYFKDIYHLDLPPKSRMGIFPNFTTRIQWWPFNIFEMGFLSTISRLQRTMFACIGFGG